GADRTGDRSHDLGLARAWRGDDQPTLSLADRGRDVDHPAQGVGAVSLQAEPLGRVDRGEVGELGALLGSLGLRTVDRVDPDHRIELLPTFPLTGMTHLADESVSAA